MGTEEVANKGGEERKVASNCLENESKRAEKSRKLKMNQRTAPPIAGGNPKQRRTQGGVVRVKEGRREGGGCQLCSLPTWRPCGSVLCKNFRVSLQRVQQRRRRSSRKSVREMEIDDAVNKREGKATTTIERIAN